jgi:uncharacterized RDD family membrane protein YckC
MRQKCETVDGENRSAVKCPKCGFVSFPGLDLCKKCGYPLAPGGNQEPGAPPLFRHISADGARAETIISKQPEDQDRGARLENGNLNSLAGPGKPSLDVPGQAKTEEGASESAPSMDWQKELLDRMQEFRRRRARIYDDEEDAQENLNLDSKSPASGQDITEPQPNVITFPSFDELNPEDDPSEGEGVGRDWDEFAQQEMLDQIDLNEAPRAEPEQLREEPPAPPPPLEIELDSSPASDGVIGLGVNESPLEVAPWSKRLFAGIFDLLVLLLAGSVFGLIFWRAGGQFALSPLNMVVVGLVGGIFLMAYFGVFTVLAYGTPGLIWAGLEVRTFEGDLPKRTDCFWRSFGYLVSTSALLLGFIWALVDGEGLTWHDRMSRTLLVNAREQENPRTGTSFLSLS